jgi:lipopolysaccharide export system permease protein
MTKEFVKGFIISLFIFVFIYIIIDLFEDLGKYLEQQASITVLAKFYFYQSFPYIVLLMPIAAMMGTFYSLGMMARNNEVITIRTSGVQMAKVLIIYPTLAVILTLVSFLLSEYVATWANHHLRKVRIEEIFKRKRRIFRMRNFFYLSPHNKLYRIRSLDVTNQKIYGLYIWDLEENLRIKRTITAHHGIYDSGWTLYNVTERIFFEDGERVDHYDSLGGNVLPEAPEELARSPKPVEEMRFDELIQEVVRRRLTGADVKEESVELNYRFSSPFINLILVLMAIPFALRLKRGGLAVGIGISIVVAFIYWGLIQTFRAYGIGGQISPFLSAWIPNFIFGILVSLSYLGVEQ